MGGIETKAHDRENWMSTVGIRDAFGQRYSKVGRNPSILLANECSGWARVSRYADIANSPHGRIWVSGVEDVVCMSFARYFERSLL